MTSQQAIPASTLRADILLLLAAAFWGAGFVAQKAGMDHMGPLAFTGLRFLLGALILLPLILVRDRFVPPAERADLRHIRPRELILASVVLAGAASLQQAASPAPPPAKPASSPPSTSSSCPSWVWRSATAPAGAPGSPRPSRSSAYRC